MYLIGNVVKSRYLGWLDEDVSLALCARRLKVHPSTVSRLNARAKEGEGLERRKGSGRTRKTSKRDIRIIRDAITKDPRQTAKSIKMHHKKTLSHLSIRTVSRVLYEDLKLQSFVAAKKPFLSKGMKQRRLHFANKYKKWKPKQWDDVLFTDEASFETTYSTGGPRVRRVWGEGRYEDKYTKKNFKKPPSLMVWASFSSSSTGDIFFLESSRTMTASLFIEVARNHLIPSMKKLQAKAFVLDRATCHTAKKTVKFLNDNRLNTIFLPANSPDLNPI